MYLAVLSLSRRDGHRKVPVLTPRADALDLGP
jgi:hypothetical protein